jgi:hypothetical protein
LESSHGSNRSSEIIANPSGPSAEEAAASPRGWLTRNGPYLVVIAGLFLFLHYYFEMDLDDLRKIIFVILGLGLVIFIHELGHFAVAKWCGVKVERFSIGFGPILWKATRGDIQYRLRPSPAGLLLQMG